MTAVSPGKNGSTSPIYRPTYWKCVNWHNLVSQEGPLKEDIFNLGPNESGKTTWLDGFHAAITLGEPHMEWNSAADPIASAAKLRNRGRTINDVLYRANLEGPTLTGPQISYFLVEFKGRDLGDVWTIGVGAFATHYEAEPDKWGILVNRPARDVQLVDPAAKTVHDFQRLEALYGRDAVLRPIRFRRALSEQFYGTLEHYEEVLNLLKLSKSYSRLAQQQGNFSDLFRRVLPPPNPKHFEDARTDLRSIHALNNNVNSSQDLLEKLGEISGAVAAVARETAALGRYDYKAALHAYDNLIQDQTATAHKKKEQEEQRDQSEKSARDAASRRDAAQRLAQELAGSDAAELVRAAATAKKELDDANTLKARRDKKYKDANADAQEKEAKFMGAWRTLSESLRALDQTLKRLLADLPEWVPAAFRANVERAAATANSLTQDAEQVPSDVDHSRNLANEVVRTLTLDLQQAIANAEAQRGLLEDQIKPVQAELDGLANAKDDPPTPLLQRALDGMPSQQFVTVYQNAEPFAGREADAALLEAFLPREVLGAIVPTDAAATEKLRRHVARRAPGLRTVDAAGLSLPDPDGLAGHALLRILDPKATHPLVYAYLQAEYGNVLLLNVGADRGDHPRVVWRDGEVYDGHAWRLQLTGPEGRYIGAAARKRALESRRLQLSETIAALKRQVEAHVRTIDSSTSRKKRLGQALADVEAAFQRAALGLGIQALTNRRTLHQAAQLTLASAREELEAAARDAEGRKTIWEGLHENVRKTGAQAVQQKLENALDKQKAASDEHEKAAEKRTEHRLEAEKAGQRLTELVQLIENARQTRDQARQKLLDLGPSEGFTEATLESYLQARGFDRIELGNLPTLSRESDNRRAKAQQQTHDLILALGQRRALAYDEVTNMVQEAVTRNPLQALLEQLRLDLEARRRELVKKTEELGREVFVQRIAANLKQEVADMEDLLERVNQELKTSPLNDHVFQVRRRKIQDEPDVARMRSLIMESSAEISPAILGEFMSSQLTRTSLDTEDVPPLFDYRQWYEFRMVRIDPQTGRETDETQFAKASGGGQAIPRYLFCFTLFRTLYDRCGAKLRLVLIDEAFQRISPGNIEQLIQFAKQQQLWLVVTNTELDGATPTMRAGCVQMFNRNARNETRIRPWSFERTTEKAVATR